MKYEVGDRVKAIKDIGCSEGNLPKGSICTVLEVSDCICKVLDCVGRQWTSVIDSFELTAPIISEIKEKKLTCCINVRSIAEAQFLDDFFECKSYLREYCENAYKERMRLGYYRTLENGVAFQLTDGVINDNCSANFYRSCGSRYGEVYEFSDLFPVGSIMMGGDCAYKHTESGIEKYKITATPPRYADGGTVSIHDLPTSEWYNPMRLTFKNGSSIEALPQKDDTVRGKNHFCDGFRGGKILTPEKPVSIKDQVDSLADAWAKLGCTTFNLMTPNKKEDKPMKLIFYTEDGYRIDKSNNTKVETVTTSVDCFIGDLIYSGCATCDKSNYESRQGVLEAVANAFCGGNAFSGGYFNRVYDRAVKENERYELATRTCNWCGKTFNTVEEREAHEAWHIERKMARRERYLLRKRAKEIAFEEQAQKMAKEMIKEDK